jgi:tryptophan 2,3-dioxygenase
MDDWSRAALALPECHPAPDAGADRLNELLGAAHMPAPEDLARLNVSEARRTALDVLMVEAFCRCRDVALNAHARARLEQAAVAVAARLDVPPIISYPLYIRANRVEWGRMRRFTPTDEEHRFIAMHRLIEDQFDTLIERLEDVLAVPDAGHALVDALPVALEGFRRVNRTIAAFRSPERMDRDVFNNGFRPYFASVERDGRFLNGPSGLQSPTFRVIAMLAGYRDPVLDSFTEGIMPYHEPETRAWLRRVRDNRDAGMSLARFDELWFGDEGLSGGGVAHIHPDYGLHASDLLEVALADGTVSRDIEAVLATHDVVIGEWPRGAAAIEGPTPPRGGLRAAGPALAPGAAAATALDPAVAGAAARVDAALFGFHLEHAAITAHQIGYMRGTGGTSGVEFLLMATFRRGLPRLWHSGMGREYALASIAAT